MYLKSLSILLLLAALTLWGLWQAFLGHPDWIHWTFWGSAQLLPASYILLAWWGSHGHSANEPDLSAFPEFESSLVSEGDPVA